MNSQNCLISGQATICLQDDGVLFTITPLLGKSYGKLIPYADIQSVKVGPRWWLFPGFRILTRHGTKFFIEPGMHTGHNFKHNQITFPFWRFKKWEIMAKKIRSKSGVFGIHQEDKDAK